MADQTTINPDGLDIPDEYLPEHPDQIPAWALDRNRYLICFAIGRAVAQRDDPLFVSDLYMGPLKTGDLKFEPPDSGGSEPPAA